jgi:hypothetical protein
MKISKNIKKKLNIKQFIIKGSLDDTGFVNFSKMLMEKCDILRKPSFNEKCFKIIAAVISLIIDQ